MIDTKKGSSAVYNINYHIVWVTKYRRTVLNTDIRKTLDTIIRTICASRNWDVLEFKPMEDHVHLFISCPPFESPTGIVKILKGVSAKQLFQAHPELRDVLKYGHLWSPSYYVGTAGYVSAEIIERYIRELEKENGGRTSPIV